MKLFITGSEGLIAQDLLREKILDGHQRFNFDNRANSEDDLTNLVALHMKFPPEVDLVLHLANIPHPDPDIPVQKYQQNNVQGCKNLLAVAKDKGAGGIVFFSSLAAVGFDVAWFYRHAYGVNAPIEFTPGDEETAKLLPLDAWTLERYGCSKVNQEKLIIESGLRYLILRLGPYRDVVCDSTRKVVAKILRDGITESGIIHVPLKPEWGGKKLKEFLSAERGVSKRGRPRRSAKKHRTNT